MTDDAATFEAHRSRLVGLAYRMTGSLAEAEDAVQEAWLRWQRADRSDVRAPGAWLSRTVTRLCVDALTSARARRETYVGPWLPEPLVHDVATAEATAQLADDVSMAMMLALERLSPLERAAFLLREVFDLDYADVAEALGRSEAACRQLTSRAKAHVRAGRPRRTPSAEEHARVLGAFAAAVQAGDADQLTSVLAEDVVFLSDGGGKVLAALRPIQGADPVGRFLLGLARQVSDKPGTTVMPATVNGQFGFVVREHGAPVSVLACEVADGRIAAIYAVRNPDKLARVPRDG